jgi:hypothetical protein
MQPKKSLIVIIIILILVLAGIVAFWFSGGLQMFLSPQTNVPPKDFRGVNITFNAGGKIITIPPNFSSDTLNYLKLQMGETAGLPLKLERKGNPLPFGIP